MQRRYLNTSAQRNHDFTIVELLITIVVIAILDNILVPTGIEVGDWYFTVQVPGIYGSSDIAEKTETLRQLSADQDAALRAFLSLPDNNAMSRDIMEDFHQQYVGAFMSVEDALHELAEVDERERDLVEYAAERQLIIEQVTPDYEALHEQVADGFDLVEEEGRIYAFAKLSGSPVSRYGGVLGGQTENVAE